MITLEDRINNLEKHIYRLESALTRERNKHKIIYEDSNSDKDILTYKLLRRFYNAVMSNSDDISGLDSIIKKCLTNKSLSNEALLLLIILRAITVYCR